MKTGNLRRGLIGLAYVVVGLGLWSCSAWLGLDDAAKRDAGVKSSFIQPCVLSSDCTRDSTSICIFSVCSPECQSERDCDLGERCLHQTGDNEGAGCVASSEALCMADGQCPEGTTCVNQECRNPCSESDECRADQECQEEACIGLEENGVLLVEAGLRQPGAEAGALPDPKGKSSSSASMDAGRIAKNGDTAKVPDVVITDASLNKPKETTAALTDASVVQPMGEPDMAQPDMGEPDMAQPDMGEPGVLAPGDAGSARECEENALRCDGNAGVTRQVCTQGQWVTAEPCSAGQLCDTIAELSGGCADVATECQGRSPGEIYCALSERIACGPDLLSAQFDDCLSTQHCEAALSEEPSCPSCIQGEFSCDGDSLSACNSDEGEFILIQECNAGECNALSGACSSFACEVGQLRCESDALYGCSTDRSNFDVEVEPCGPGLCNTLALVCDACQAGTSGCADEQTINACNAQGSQLSETACPTSTPFCPGDTGTCVECIEDEHCDAGGECYTASCNAGSGTCSSVPKASSTACGNGGLCDGSGNCVDCVGTADCSASSACHAASCTNNLCGEQPIGLGTPCAFDGGNYCDGSGSCVECVSAATCSPQNDCFSGSCDGFVCSDVAVAGGTSCNFDGGSYCDGAGACVECTAPSQCNLTNACYTADCSGNSCSETAKSSGTLCDFDSGSYCDGSGACVQCLNAGQCTPTNGCFDAECSGNSCGESLKASGALCDFDTGNYCDGSGACVECVAASSCTTSGDCYAATCTGHSCGETPKSNGSSCASSGGRVCESGTCVECIEHADCSSSSDYCSASNTCEPNNPYDIGLNSATGGTVMAVADNQLWGTKITVTEAVSVQGIGMFGAAGAGFVRLALYEHDATLNAPGAYVAWTSDITAGPGLRVGPNEEVTNLTPGTYWVVAVWAANSSADALSIYRISDTASRATRKLSHTYSELMPDPYPGNDADSYTSRRLSLFIRVMRDTN